jgi:SAM-dependent MidA family methyltransferase
VAPSTAGEAAGTLSAQTVEALRARTEPDGFLPFDRFMDIALYGTGFSYYRRERSPFGPSGDYYTAPRVHPLYARSFARRIVAVRAALGSDRRFRLVDLGSGDGLLLRGILTTLGERAASGGVEAVVVDRAPARRSGSLAAVAATARAVGATATSAGSLAELGPVVGVVLAHELLDAQPVRRLRWDGATWRELGFRFDDGLLRPAEGPLVSPVPPPELPRLSAEQAGVELDVAPAAEALLREVADHLARGLLIVVDFGAEERELLAAHPQGTVAAVRGHRDLGSAGGAPGDADLSSFVNFTRLRRSSSIAGLVTLADRSQAEALGAWGFPRELEQALAGASSGEERVRIQLAAKNLLFGFGNFRILELSASSTAEGLRRLSEAGREGSS